MLAGICVLCVWLCMYVCLYEYIYMYVCVSTRIIKNFHFLDKPVLLRLL